MLPKGQRSISYLPMLSNKGSLQQVIFGKTPVANR